MENLIWRVEKRKVTDLKNWDKNPRKITEEAFEKLKERITKRGFHDVIKTDGFDVILSGNQRKRALMDLGVEEVNIMVPNRELTEEEKDAVALESNRNDGMWDIDMLANSFDIDTLKDIGFTDIELGFGFDKETEEQVPSVPTTVHSQVGDLYQLGRHFVLCGDATKTDDVDRLMQGKKAGMVFTDPPYNVAYVGKTKDKLTIENDQKSQEDFRDFVDGFISNLLAYCEGAIYVCMSSSEWGTIQDSFKRLGGHWSRVIVWVKDKMVLSRADYHTQFEPIMVLNEDENEEGLPILYGWAEGAKRVWNGGRKQTDIWQVKRPIANKEHPTMKPVELVSRAIMNSSAHGSIVLDLFLGSGSTLIACEETGRACCGMELDPKYVDVIVERYVRYRKDSNIKKNGEDIVWPNSEVE